MFFWDKVKLYCMFQCQKEHEATKNEIQTLLGIAQRKDEFKSEVLIIIEYLK